MGPGQCTGATHDNNGDAMPHHCTTGKRAASRMPASHVCARMCVPQPHTPDGAHTSASCTATREGQRPELNTRGVGLAPAKTCVSESQRQRALQAAWPSTRRAAACRSHCARATWQAARSVDECPAWTEQWDAHAHTPGALTTAGDAPVRLRHSSWSQAAGCAGGGGDSWLGGSCVATHAGLRRAQRMHGHQYPAAAGADPAAAAAAAAADPRAAAAAAATAAAAPPAAEEEADP